MRTRAASLIVLLTALLTLPPAFCVAPEAQKTPPAAAKKKPQKPQKPQTVAAPSAPENDQKYGDVLYPAGPPSRENYDTGAKETVRYTLHGEALLPSGKSVILYSESVGDAKKDHTFWVFLAVLGRGEGKPRLLHRTEITDRLPLRKQGDGDYLRIAGRANAYSIAPASEAVDVHVWALLSGTGGISEATDFFYRVDPDGALHLLLDAGTTAAYGRSGWKRAEETTGSVSMSPSGEAIDVARWTRITESSEPGEGKTTCRAEPRTDYIFREGKYVRSAAVSATEAAAMHPLPRLAFLDPKPCAEGVANAQR